MGTVNDMFDLNVIGQEFFDRSTSGTNFSISIVDRNTIMVFEKLPDPITKPFTIHPVYEKSISFIVKKDRHDFLIKNIENLTMEPRKTNDDKRFFFNHKKYDFLISFEKDEMTILGEEHIHYHRTITYQGNDVFPHIMRHVCENMTLLLFGKISDQLDTLSFKIGEYVSPIQDQGETFLLTGMRIKNLLDRPTLMCECAKHRNTYYSFLHTNDIMLFPADNLTRSTKQKTLEYFQNKPTVPTV